MFCVTTLLFLLYSTICKELKVFSPQVYGVLSHAHHCPWSLSIKTKSCTVQITLVLNYLDCIYYYCMFTSPSVVKKSNIQITLGRFKSHVQIALKLYIEFMPKFPLLKEQKGSLSYRSLIGDTTSQCQDASSFFPLLL